MDQAHLQKRYWLVVRLQPCIFAPNIFASKNLLTCTNHVRIQRFINIRIKLRNTICRYQRINPQFGLQAQRSYVSLLSKLWFLPYWILPLAIHRTRHVIESSFHRYAHFAENHIFGKENICKEVTFLLCITNQLNQYSFPFLLGNPFIFSKRMIRNFPYIFDISKTTHFQTDVFGLISFIYIIIHWPLALCIHSDQPGIESRIHLCANLLSGGKGREVKEVRGSRTVG